MNFFIYIYKITCKPMGKFAENFNLGKRVLHRLETNFQRRIMYKAFFIYAYGLHLRLQIITISQVSVFQLLTAHNRQK